MDAQLKRGMLEACVLSVLCKGKSYGYQLIKDISACVDMSESTLYPILRRLEGAGMVTVSSAEYNGRLRKYYEISQIGSTRLDEYKNEWQEVIKVYNFIYNNQRRESQ